METLQSVYGIRLNRETEMNVNHIYAYLVGVIAREGELVPTRNGNTYRVFDLPTLEFCSTPLVTIRRTAWKKAIKEMEWFLSGNPLCPPELLNWWSGQLNRDGEYLRGYGSQLRHYGGYYDQIENLIIKINTNPFNRTHVITTWNPKDMARITEINNNPNTPCTCHTTVCQFFVSQNRCLSMHSYQRSADMLLGVPHNWIQSWAFLLWMAKRTNTVPHKMLWTFGDAHIYREPSHMAVVHKMATLRIENISTPYLQYTGQSEKCFAADDFKMVGDIPEPAITIQPRLI